MSEQLSLITDPIPKVLVQMSAPMLLGLFAVLSFNLVDTFFIARLGTEALAAISFTFPITMVVSSLAMGLGTALSALVGHLLGQQRSDAAARCTTDGLLLTLLLALTLAVVGVISIDPLFRLLGATPRLINLIHDYIEIWYLAMPMLMLPMVGNSATRATGNTRTPSLVMLIAGCVNAILDPLFIFGWGNIPALGIKGAAIATAIAWFFAFVVSLYALRHQDQLLLKCCSGFSHLREHWRALAEIAIPATGTNLLTPLAVSLLLGFLTRFGAEAVAAYGAVARIEALLLLVMVALASVLAPFTSQNVGAGTLQRAEEGVLFSMRFALWFQLLIALLIALIAKPVAAIFSTQSEVQYLIESYLYWVPLSYGLQALLMLLAAGLNGIRSTKHSFWFNGLRLFGLLLPLAMLGGYLFGIQGLFAGIMLTNVLAGSCAYLFTRYRFRRLLQTKTVV